MAIDHASYFIARVHPFETWATPPPYYGSATAFVTRWITHLCAPGFFLLMGAGMTWFADSRRAAGWTMARIRRVLITRGAMLLAVQQFLENPAWLIGILTGSPAADVRTSYPGGTGDAFLFFAVITALGVALIFWALWLGAPTPVVWTVTLAALAMTVLMTPPVAMPASPWRWFLLPGTTEPTHVVYPFVPWLVPAGLGVLLGRWMSHASPARGSWLVAWGAAAVGAFAILRVSALGDPHAPLPGVIGFLTITKYPPSLDFLLLTLGIDLVLLWVFMRVQTPWLAPLEVFGRVPLFFYLLHLYVFGLVSIFFPEGTSFAVMYLVWAAGLAAMYPLCRWYAGFKASRPIDSPWRLF
jgi:uncharacterized membrane protein